MSNPESPPPLPELPDIYYELTADELIQHGAATINPFLIKLGRAKKEIEDFGPVLDQDPEA